MENTASQDNFAPDVEMYVLDDGPGAPGGGDEWEDVADEESISYAIRDVLDAQSVILPLSPP